MAWLLLLDSPSFSSLVESALRSLHSSLLVCLPFCLSSCLFSLSLSSVSCDDHRIFVAQASLGSRSSFPVGDAMHPHFFMWRPTSRGHRRKLIVCEAVLAVYCYLVSNTCLFDLPLSVTLSSALVQSGSKRRFSPYFSQADSFAHSDSARLHHRSVRRTSSTAEAERAELDDNAAGTVADLPEAPVQAQNSWVSNMAGGQAVVVRGASDTAPVSGHAVDVVRSARAMRSVEMARGTWGWADVEDKETRTPNRTSSGSVEAAPAIAGVVTGVMQIRMKPLESTCTVALPPPRRMRMVRDLLLAEGVHTLTGRCVDWRAVMAAKSSEHDAQVHSLLQAAGRHR
jgi:hypothetical protein